MKQDKIMQIKLFNTLTNKKEVFIPYDKDNIRLYVCGPTVYSTPHIGNARSVVVYDVLLRILYAVYGYDKVNYVRNITDVEDKIIAAAREHKIPINKLTNDVTQDFHRAMSALGCKNPNIEPKATEHIKDLESWLQSTNSPKKPASLVSKIQYFEGFQGVKNMYSDTWRNNKTKLIRAITDPKAAVHTMKSFFYEEYMPDRMAQGVKVKDIMTDSKEGKEETKKSAGFLREAKLAKGLFEDLGIEINIYENKLAIVSFDKRNPCAVIIENEKISSAMKDIFEYMWKKI